MKLLYTAPSPSLQRWFWLLLLANILFIGFTAVYLYPLTFGDMVALEVARRVPVAEQVLQHWAAAGKMPSAIPAIYLDYGFIFLYTTGLSVGALYLGRLSGNEVLARAGKVLTYLVVAAGICDVIENLILLRILHGRVTTFNVVLAYDMAAAKFTVIILCLLFALVCIIFWLSSKLTSR